jgi:putative DNA primase/helicase
MTTPVSFSDTLAKIKADGDAQMDQLRKHVTTRAVVTSPPVVPESTIVNDTCPFAINLEIIPEPLKALPQWVCWQRERRDGKPTKVPYDSKTGACAKVNDPSTWGTFAQVTAALDHYAGIGFVLTKEDPFVGVDLDHAVDPVTGRIEPWAITIVDQLHSYTEISPSGTGLRIFLQGTLPPGRRRKGPLELYDCERYLTLTGRHLAETPRTIEARQETLQRLHAAHFPPPRVNGDRPRPAQPVLADDQTQLDRMFRSKGGAKIQALWNGNWSAYPSQSEADSALAFHLAFWFSRDATRIDQLFRQSGLFRPKWDEPHGERTYGAMTLARACASCSETYNPPRPVRPQTPDGTPPPGPPAEGAPSEAPIAEKTEAKSEATATLPPGPDVTTAAAAESDARTRCTDVGNGELFAEQHRETVRYCYRLKQWFVWDGQRWNPDDGGRITLLAKQTALSLYARVTQEPDEHRRKALARWAVESETERRLRSMVSLAQSEPGIAIDADRLDPDPLVLNVLNGTLDLRTGDLRPARREDYITKLAPVAYHPDAACPEFDRMLTRLFGTVPAIRDYLQRILGYALTGVTTEQCFFIFYGTGANGKSTVLRTIMDLLGEYADTSRPETFLVKRGDGGIPNDVAALAGMRLVVSLESEKGKRLAEGLVKGMTGQDSMKARFLHREFFSFDPRFKLFIGTNHKPVIVGTDEAIWRRVRCVPFTVVIPDHEQDKRLLDKLRAEYEGILRWLIEGCLAWQREGLGPPLEVQDATAAYRAEQDVLGVFLKDRCVMEPTAKSTKKDLYEQYTAWCEESGERHRLTMTEFGKALRERGSGIGNARVGNAKGWGGLRLRTPLDPEPDDDPITAQDQEESDVNLDA